MEAAGLQWGSGPIATRKARKNVSQNRTIFRACGVIFRALPGPNVNLSMGRTVKTLVGNPCVKYVVVVYLIMWRRGSNGARGRLPPARPENSSQARTIFRACGFIFRALPGPTVNLGMGRNLKTLVGNSCLKYVVVVNLIM